MSIRKTVLFLLSALNILLVYPVYTRAAPAFNDNNTAVLRVVYEKKRLPLKDAPVLINGQPYLPLRPICNMLGGKVSWDNTQGKALVAYNNRYFSIAGEVVGDRMMAAPEWIGSIFGVEINYDAVLSATLIGEQPTREQLLTILPRFDTYTSDDLYWLSRIVEAEATGETYASRLAVANVIMNRLESGHYPNTIKEVIFDKKHGVQFSPVLNGTVYNEPSTKSFLAALDALEGRMVAPGALFFMNPKYATSRWMEKNRQYAYTIGGHEYYY